MNHTHSTPVIQNELSERTKRLRESWERWEREQSVIEAPQQAPVLGSIQEHDLSQVPLGVDEPNLVWNANDDDDDPPLDYYPKSMRTDRASLFVFVSEDAARVYANVTGEPFEPYSEPLEDAIQQARDAGRVLEVYDERLRLLEVF